MKLHNALGLWLQCSTKDTSENGKMRHRLVDRRKAVVYTQTNKQTNKIPPKINRHTTVNSLVNTEQVNTSIHVLLCLRVDKLVMGLVSAIDSLTSLVLHHHRTQLRKSIEMNRSLELLNCVQAW